MPWMIAHKIDLFLLHDTTIAITVPKPIPGAIYTGREYSGFPVAAVVQDASNKMKTQKETLSFFVIMLF